MKQIPTRQAWGGKPVPVWGGILAGIALLTTTSIASAQVSVATIGGGPRTECGNTAGFAGGVTYTHSQFHYPSATAVDSLGDLWVADTDNSAIEWITQAGNKTSSVTFQYSSGGNLHKFPNVIGLAIDAGDNLYVLTTTNLTKFIDVTGSLPNLNPEFSIPLSTFSSSPATAIAVANDANTNIYISFSGGPTGTIVQIPQPFPSSPLFTTIVSQYAFSPGGLAVRDDGQLAISDVLNNGIYVVPTVAESSPTLVTGAHGNALINGGPGVAAFNQPRGIAASADGRMIVADTGNNAVRIIDTSYNTTTLFGTPTNLWSVTCCSCNPALYAGWVDGSAGLTGSSASARQPLSLSISASGDVFETEGFYNLIRLVTGTGLTPVISFNGGGSTSTNQPTVTTLPPSQITANSAMLNATVDPNGTPVQFYFAYGTDTNSLTNYADVTQITTNLGGTNSYSVTLTGLTTGTRIYFQAVAGNSQGAVLSFLVSASSSSSANQLGFGKAHFAGIGSTVFVPIEIQLVSGVTINSFEFNLTVTPSTNGGAGTPPPISALNIYPITTNDYVTLPSVAQGNTNALINILGQFTTTNGGIGLSLFGNPTNGVQVQNVGYVGLLSFQIPYSAATNQVYNMTISQASGGTGSHGNIGSIALAAMNQTVTVKDLPYLAGDSVPATGYNAEEFGDGQLDVGDVDNAIFASVGLNVPPLYSDAFNAMDVYPQTPGIFGENGDGLIGFADWNLILYRSLGLNTTNWLRYWTNGGLGLVGQPVADPLGLPQDPDPVFSASPPKVRPPGQIWMCQAAIGAGSAAHLTAGATVSFPVFVKVKPGCSLSGLQFRAAVNATGNGPPIDGLDFESTGGIPTPFLSQPGNSPNDWVAAWEVGAFANPLTGSNLIGTLTFQIPTNAASGSSYVIRFNGVGGAPDGTVEYALESFPGFAWVGTGIMQPPSVTSDEWKIKFFGNVSSPLAADNADADGDGVPNWQEYIAGTDPSNPVSVFKFSGRAITNNGVNGVALSWLTAPGKTYVIESIPAFGGKNWAVINTNSGDGYTYQFIQNNSTGTAQFYRILVQP